MSSPRHDWYETESHVTIEIFLKNQKAEDVKVDFTKDTVSVRAKLPTDTYELNLNLSHEINPEKSTFKVLTTKIEIRLLKVAAGKWSVLERKEIKEAGEQTPHYPSSSLVKHDWNKLEKEIEKEAENERDVTDLFRSLYNGGNSDIQRAMNKSFVESNGTVLSTNWEDVGKRKVEVKPPEGTQFKTFE